MATVWMRSKLAKMKPKVEPKWGVRTLAEHGPGKFNLHRVSTPKPRDPVEVLPNQHVQVCEPFAKPVKTPRLGKFEPIRACVVYDMSTACTLIKGRG